MTAVRSPDPSSAAQPVNPACSLTFSRLPKRASEVMQFNAPTHTKLSLFRPVFRAPKASEFRADKPFTRCLNRPSELLFRNPFGMTGGDPKHTRAEQEES